MRLITIPKNESILSLSSIKHIDINNIYAIADIIGESFCDSEPMSKHLKIHEFFFTKWATQIIKNCMHDKMSFYTSDIKSNILGCLYSNK
jgi:hypothetical protein